MYTSVQCTNVKMYHYKRKQPEQQKKQNEYETAKNKSDTIILKLWGFPSIWVGRRESRASEDLSLTKAEAMQLHKGK